MSPIEQSIKRKIETTGTPLKDWNVNIYRGILTGYNDAFIISGEKRAELLAACATEEERIKTDELIRPILRGRDIKRYNYEYADLYIIATFPAKHYNIDDYPAVKAHLLSYGIERLEQTGKEYIVDGKKVKARKKTNNQWFETQDSISYWDDFNKQKIVWKIIGNQMAFAIDSDNYIVNNACYILTGKYLKYLCSILNSKLIKWYSYITNMNKTGVGDVQVGGQNVNLFPIPKFINKERDLLTHLVDLILIKKANKDDVSDVEQQIDSLIYAIYDLTEEEIKVIEEN